MPSTDDEKHHARELDIVNVVSRMVGLMEEQNILLRDLSSRWAMDAGVTSLNRIPPQSVPSRSISAWKPLLRSFSSTVRPLIDRWRRNLDTTLIFIGLFSAIITAFFVESLNALKPDEGSQTNILLANLTEIVVLLSRNNSADLQRFSTVLPFEPDPNEVRFSFYCALSLTLSISTAAIAVAGHAFLSSLTHAHGDSVAQLTDQYHRWLSAKSFLGPAIETIPQLLTIPVAVFILGLLDKLFSSSLYLPVASNGLLAASIICGVCVATMVISMLVALCHGFLYPETSPFQSTLLRYVKLKVLNKRTKMTGGNRHRDGELSQANCEVFHKVIQETHDDQSLEQASAAVSNIMIASFKLRSSFLSFSPLPTLELQTLLHLLSPDASIQSNLAAAMVICDSGVLYYYWDSTHHRVGVDPTQRAALLRALVRAATHAAASNSYREDWHWRSPFTRALSFLVHYPESTDAWPDPLLGLFSANAFKEPPPTILVEAHKEASLYAMKLLVSRLKHALKTVHADLIRVPNEQIDEAILRLFGPTKLDRHQLVSLMKSLVFKPAETKEAFLRFTHKDESYSDHAVVLSGLARWLGRSHLTMNAAIKIVSETPISFFAIHTHQTQNMMLILLNILQPNTLSSLRLSSKFLDKACTSAHQWEKYNESLALSIISRFLHVFVGTMDLWMEESQESVEEYCEVFMRVRRWVDANVALLDVDQDIQIHTWLIHANWGDVRGESIQKRIDAASAMLEERLEMPFRTY